MYYQLKQESSKQEKNIFFIMIKKQKHINVNNAGSEQHDQMAPEGKKVVVFNYHEHSSYKILQNKKQTKK